MLLRSVVVALVSCHTCDGMQREAFRREHYLGAYAMFYPSVFVLMNGRHCVTYSVRLQAPCIAACVDLRTAVVAVSRGLLLLQMPRVVGGPCQNALRTALDCKHCIVVDIALRTDVKSRRPLLQMARVGVVRVHARTRR